MLENTDLIVKERRLRWIGNLVRTDWRGKLFNRTCTAKRKSGRPRKMWNVIIRLDLKAMSMTWKEAQQIDANWKESVDVWPNVL